MIPQLIYFALTMVGLGVSLMQHGKPKDGTHNVLPGIIATVLVYLLLWWGGFWDCFTGG